MKHLLAGTGRSDITPTPGVPQGGWGAQTHQRGSGADMPLYATALVLSDGSKTVAIVDADARGFDMEWTNKIIKAIVELTGLSRECLRFSCTHTHSSPNTSRLSGVNEGLNMTLSYLESLPLRIAGAVWKACQNLRPVRCGTGIGQCNIGVNRRFRSPEGTMVVGRNWRGAVDPAVGVLRFDALDETPVATIVHYACHPTTMAWQNQMFTPDYPGACRQVVEEQVGGLCLFLQGAAGNITPRRGFTGDLQVYRWLGRLLGLEAARVALQIETLPRREKFIGIQQSGAAIALYDDEAIEPQTPVLRMCSRMVSMPLREFGDPVPQEKEAEELRGKLNKLRESGSQEEVRAMMAQFTQTDLRAKMARLYQGKDSVDWEMQGLRIGNAALLSMRGEPFTEIGVRIKSSSPFQPTFVSGYSNGVFGYIPIREAFEEGGYEVTTGSPFSHDAADVIVAEGLEILNDLMADENE